MVRCYVIHLEIFFVVKVEFYYQRIFGDIDDFGLERETFSFRVWVKDLF